MILLTGEASAIVLTFDDLPITGTPPNATGAYFDSLPSATYNGFSFANQSGNRWFWNPNRDLVPGGPFNGVNDSTWVGVDTTATPEGASDNVAPAITSAVDFNFDGASFAGFDPVRFKLYLDGALVSTSIGCSLTNVSTFCASGYSGLVDTVVIENLTPAGVPPGAYFSMDNFTYNTVSAVPVPGALMLLASGLPVLARYSRRRKQTCLT